MAHIMHDLETFGNTPGSALRSLGAVVFDPATGEIGAIFYANISRASCERIGLTVDPKTEAWWLEQSPEAQAALEYDQQDIEAVAAAFADWYATQGGDRLWCQGPSYDACLLEAVYRALGQKTPWAYNAPRDTRTVYDLAGITPDRNRASLHNALEDARAQAEAVHEGYVKLGLSRSGDPMFGGRGGPLRPYRLKDADWPPQWRLPEDPADLDENDQDLFGRMAWLADDLVLRSAVNIWDNALRIPQAFEGIAGGMLSAHARFCSPMVITDLEGAADAVREGWLGMARQAQALAQNPTHSSRCKHCGCTETRACDTPEGPCHWVAPEVCSAAACVAKETDAAAASSGTGTVQ